MKKLLWMLLLCTGKITAQKLVPRFENDTLYTTSGYKIYKGQTLNFAVGTGRNGNFRYAKVKTDDGGDLTGAVITVKRVSDFSISGLGNGYIKILGSVVYKDGSKGSLNINLAFDKAIESFPGLPNELVVPEEFRSKSQTSTADEIRKFYDLYRDSILTKEEFQKQKLKLLGAGEE